MEPNIEPRDNTNVPFASAAQTTNDEWMTLLLVLICRAFLAVIIAFAKAILLVAHDAEARTVTYSGQESFNNVYSSIMDEIYKL